MCSYSIFANEEAVIGLHLPQNDPFGTPIDAADPESHCQTGAKMMVTNMDHDNNMAV